MKNLYLICTLLFISCSERIEVGIIDSSGDCNMYDRCMVNLTNGKLVGYINKKDIIKGQPFVRYECNQKYCIPSLQEMYESFLRCYF